MQKPVASTQNECILLPTIRRPAERSGQPGQAPREPGSLFMSPPLGRHFLQIPGPSTVPERIRSAIGAQVIDHRGPEFQRLGREVLVGCRTVFKTTGQVVIYPSSGTGGWEAAIVNTLSPGDRVLMVETGHFARLWRNMAER